MITYFLNKKYNIYRAEYIRNGLGESVIWSMADTIRAKIEPAYGEEFLESKNGDSIKISLIIYSKSEFFAGDRICLKSGWFEIRHCEYYRMPFISYWKGYLVKCDEKLSV